MDYYEEIGYAILYIGFLFLMFRRMVSTPINALIIALCVFLAQMLLPELIKGLTGYAGFLPFLFFLGRFLGVYHPPAQQEEPLNWKRKLLGWLALIVFLVCFSPQPFIID